jgi:hypothetical protein
VAEVVTEDIQIFLWRSQMMITSLCLFLFDKITRKRRRCRNRPAAGASEQLAGVPTPSRTQKAQLKNRKPIETKNLNYFIYRG